MKEYVEMKSKSIDLQIAEDMAEVLVDEQGHPDSLKTLGLAMVMLAFAHLKARTSAMLRPPATEEHEKIYGRAGLVPKPLSFWVHTMVGSVGRERALADANTLWDRRLLDGLNMTALDQ